MSTTARHRLVQSLGLFLLLPLMAQAQVITINDLPTCALPCATRAALDVGCTLNDTACLCSHPAFTTSTIDCSRKNGQCALEDRGGVVGVLAGLCLLAPSLPSSSASSQPTTISNSQSTTQNVSSASSSTVSSTASSSSTSSTSSTTSSASSSTTTSSTTTSDTSISVSSTVVVVQTVLVPPTSLASSSDRRDVLPKAVSMISMLLVAVGAGGWVAL